MKAILFFTLSLTVFSFPAQGNFTNTLDLLNKCSASQTASEMEQFQEIHCLGYLLGLVEGVQLVFNVRPESKFFCQPPKGVSPEQLLQIIKKWVKNNPKFATESARMTTLIAYGKKFPCN